MISLQICHCTNTCFSSHLTNDFSFGKGFNVIALGDKQLQTNFAETLVVKQEHKEEFLYVLLRETVLHFEWEFAVFKTSLNTAPGKQKTNNLTCSSL